ncbi:MAG: hypothetical protein HC783_18870 [Rhodobacteraceae bacterium]|nr:hypothetical protein [Paracoccaceae bacterium]
MIDALQRISLTDFGWDVAAVLNDLPVAVLALASQDAIANFIGTVKRTSPAHMVAIQLNR